MISFGIGALRLQHRGCSLYRSFTSMRLKTKVQKFATAGARKKAKIDKQVGPDSFQWLLAEDRANLKRKRDTVDNWKDEPTITLDASRGHRINPAFLSHGLKRKFPGILECTPSSSIRRCV